MRLIDADKLPKYNGCALSANEVAMAVENAPTVDAEPVCHALWIKHGKPNVLFWSCSCCGQVERDMTPYCCSCGAKMDGGET